MTTHITIPPAKAERERHLEALKPETPKYKFDDPWGDSGNYRGGWGNHPRVVDTGTWTHIFLDNDRIAIAYADQVRGLTKNGKSFSRITNRGRVVFTWQKGPLRVFSTGVANRKRQVRDVTAGFSGAWMGDRVRRDRNLTPHLLDRYSGGDFEFPSWSDERIPARAERNQRIWQRIAYPVLREAPHWDAVAGMSQALRQHNVQDFTRVAFGNTRYRKDLVKAIASAPNLNGVWLAHELKTTFPIDWLIPVAAIGLPQLEGFKRIKEFMRWLPEYAGKKLVAEWTARDSRFFFPRWEEDTLKSWAAILKEKPNYELGAYRVTNWRDLHDHLARELTKIGREDREITPTKLAKKLDGKSADGIRLVHPKSTHELIDWGRDMHNCIGGYDREALSGRSVLFAVMRGDEMIGNMELTPKGSIRQLVGDYNRSLDARVRNTVMSLVAGKPVEEAAEIPLEPYF